MAWKHAFSGLHTAIQVPVILTVKIRLTLSPELFPPRSIPTETSFESQFAQSYPVVVRHCSPPALAPMLSISVQLHSLPLIISSCLLYLFVCSFPCPHQLLSHFVTGKGFSPASPLLNCAVPALGGNESHSSFSTLHDKTLGKTLLYLLQMCLMVIHINFLSSFPHQSVSIESFLFCSLHSFFTPCWFST